MNQQLESDFELYKDGKKLRGNDFSEEQIQQWFAEEEEGYANLGAKNKDAYTYKYHALNHEVSFKHIKGMHFPKALGIGSAYGDEFKPILNQIDHITILDPSDHFKTTDIDGTPCDYRKPAPNGTIPLEDNSVDLAVGFATFHHIPNVEYVLSEVYRVLKKDGIFLVREPIVSMGDWSKPRGGLTKNERGIPYQLFKGFVENIGFKIEKSTPCVFRVVPVMAGKMGVSAYTNPFWTKLDIALSSAFRWNINYHPTSPIQYIRPVALALVLKK